MQHPDVLLLHTKSDWGGAQKYIFDIATHAARAGLCVHVAAGGYAGLGSRVREQHISYHTLQHGKRDVSFLREWYFVRELYRLFRALRPRALHVNGSKMGALGAIIGRIALGRTVRIIYSTHGIPTFEPRVWWQKIFIWLALQCAIPFMDVVIAISRRDAEGMRAQFFGTSHKLHHIPISIDPKDYHFSPRAHARAKISNRIGYDIPENMVVTATIAERTANKSLDTLVRAAAQLSDLPLCIVLFGWGEETEILKKQITQLRVPHIFLADGTDAARLLRGCDIFVLTSVKEGLPYTLLEAGLAGCALVGTRVGGIPDVIVHEKTGLLCPARDADCISKTLRALTQNTVQRGTLGKNASMRVASMFGIARMMNETLRIYEDGK